jgi:hypothetical protein
MPDALLELAVSRLLSRGRLFEHALHGHSGTWKAVACGDSGRIAFPVACEVTGDRAVFCGYLDEPGFTADAVEIWHDGIPVYSSPFPGPFRSPLRFSVRLFLAAGEIAA